MRKLLQILGTCLIIFTSLQGLSQTEDLPRCAVLSLSPAKEASISDAALLANRIAVELQNTGSFDVMARNNANKLLYDNRILPQDYDNVLEFCKAACLTLKVRYLVYGAVERDANSISVSAALYDDKSGSVTKNAAYQIDGSVRDFSDKGVGELIGTLTGFKPRPPAPTQPAPAIQPVAQTEKPPAAPDQTIAEVEPEPIASEQPVAEADSIPAAVEPPPRIETPDQPQLPESAETGVFPEIVAIPESTARPSGERAIAGIDLDAFKASIAAATDGVYKQITGHLEVGARIVATRLFKETKDTFLGSINKLDVVDSGIQPRLFADWFFTENIGIELAWDKVESRTVTEPYGNSDGSIVMKGPVISGIYRCRDYAPFVPFGGVGLAFFAANFNHEDWWHYGYPSPEEWLAMGAPQTSLSGRIRTMDLSDSVGVALQAGCLYEVNTSFSMELFSRVMFLEAKDHYTVTLDGELLTDRGTTTFPLNNISYGVGCRYSF